MLLTCLGKCCCMDGSCLVIIGLLPSAIYKLRDRIGLVVWLIISVAMAVGWCHYTLQKISGLLQIREDIWLVTYVAAVHYPKLVRDSSIPNPSHPWLFLIVVFSNLVRVARFILRERAISNLKKSHLPRFQSQKEPFFNCLKNRNLL